MPILKKVKQQGYSIVDNAILGSAKISAKAKVILLYLLSKPDGWKVFQADVVNHMKEGRDAVAAGFVELSNLGHVRRIQVRAQNGQFLGWEYEVREVPAGPDEPTTKIAKPGEYTDDQLRALADLAAIERSEGEALQ